MAISSHPDRIEKQINVQKIKYVLGFFASTYLKYSGAVYVKARQAAENPWRPEKFNWLGVEGNGCRDHEISSDELGWSAQFDHPARWRPYWTRFLNFFVFVLAKNPRTYLIF